MRTHASTSVATQFLSAHRKIVRACVLLAVSLCMLDHVIEQLIGWDQQMVQTGRDTETTLFLVFLLVGLVFALVDLIQACKKLFRKPEGLLDLLQVAISAAPLGPAIDATSSPPLPLRI